MPGILVHIGKRVKRLPYARFTIKAGAGEKAIAVAIQAGSPYLLNLFVNHLPRDGRAAEFALVEGIALWVVGHHIKLAAGVLGPHAKTICRSAPLAGTRSTLMP